MFHVCQLLSGEENAFHINHDRVTKIETKLKAKRKEFQKEISKRNKKIMKKQKGETKKNQI